MIVKVNNKQAEVILSELQTWDHLDRALYLALFSKTKEEYPLELMRLSFIREFVIIDGYAEFTVAPSMTKARIEIVSMSDREKEVLAMEAEGTAMIGRIIAELTNQGQL